MLGMTPNKVRILDHEGASARIKRMAFEIYERNYLESEVILIGIDIRGAYLASQLYRHLKEEANFELKLGKASLDRIERQGKLGNINVDFSIELSSLMGKVVVLVDDVLYSGNTMLHVVTPILAALPKKIETAVLIDRGHRNMPIYPNYVGMELATTLQQHVSVEISESTPLIETFLQ